MVDNLSSSLIFLYITWKRAMGKKTIELKFRHNDYWNKMIFGSYSIWIISSFVHLLHLFLLNLILFVGFSFQVNTNGVFMNLFNWKKKLLPFFLFTWTSNCVFLIIDFNLSTCVFYHYNCCFIFTLNWSVFLIHSNWHIPLTRSLWFHQLNIAIFQFHSYSSCVRVEFLSIQFNIDSYRYI